MNVFELVKNIKKSIGRNAVITEVSITRDELVNITIPAYEKNSQQLKNKLTTLKSKTYARDKDELIRLFQESGYLRGFNPFDMIAKALKNSTDILDWLESYFNSDNAVEINGQSITLAKANAMELLTSISFAARYARSWLDLVISAEINSSDMLNEEVGLTPLQLKYLTENRAAFGKIISIIAMPIKNVAEIIEKLPEVVVAEANERALKSTLGRKADPFNFGFIQSKWNPIFFAGMLESDYAAYRYKVAKEEAAQLQMKIHRLKAKLEMQDNPKLAAIIDKNQAVLDTYRGKLHRMEEDLK